MPTYPYLTQVVHSAARSRPDQPCLIYGERRTGNAEFRERVVRLAGGLLAAGVRPGDRVAIIALNSDHFVESFFGCFWAGAVATPLNVRWTPAEMAYALNDCGTSALLIDDACLPVAGALRQDVRPAHGRPPGRRPAARRDAGLQRAHRFRTGGA